MDCANCTWTQTNHTHPIAAALTCGNFEPRVRNAAPIAADPDRCPKCKEAFTPRITKGAIKCKCDQPYLPNCANPGLHSQDCQCARERANKIPTHFTYGN